MFSLLRERRLIHIEAANQLGSNVGGEVANFFRNLLANINQVLSPEMQQKQIDAGIRQAQGVRLNRVQQMLGSAMGYPQAQQAMARNPNFFQKYVPSSITGSQQAYNFRNTPLVQAEINAMTPDRDPFLNMREMTPDEARQFTDRAKAYLERNATLSDQRFQELFGERPKQEKGSVCYLVSGLDGMAESKPFPASMKTSIKETMVNGIQGYEVRIPLGRTGGQAIFVGQNELSQLNGLIGGGDGYRVLALAYIKKEHNGNINAANQGGIGSKVFRSFLGDGFDIHFSDEGDKTEKWLRNFDPKNSIATIGTAPTTNPPKMEIHNGKQTAMYYFSVRDINGDNQQLQANHAFSIRKVDTSKPNLAVTVRDPFLEKEYVFDLDGIKKNFAVVFGGTVNAQKLYT